MLSAGREVRGLARPTHHKIQRDIVLNLLMLKFPPWLPEREKSAFKEDDDGWMSGIVSQIPTALPFWVARNSKMRALDLLAPHRVAIPLDVRVMGSSFFGKRCSRSGSADQAYPDGYSHTRDHDERTV
jgi:hypothetical protein